MLIEQIYMFDRIAREKVFPKQRLPVIYPNRH